jgi:hypothetical protein
MQETSPVFWTKSKLKTFLKPKYFHGDRDLWTAAGLPGCQSVAEALRAKRHAFSVLDVAQLLKHMLALAHNFGSGWTLCCLWFEVPGRWQISIDENLQISRRKSARTRNSWRSRYQELFVHMVPFVGQDDSEYMAYLRDRYISDVVVS